jgi:hypothetical protein
MGRILSSFDVAQQLKIPPSYVDELLQAASLIIRDFDHYGLCHHSLTLLGQRFGQYNGSDTHDVGELLNIMPLKGQSVEFDLIVWSNSVISYLKTVIERDMLDYDSLDTYCQQIGEQQYPAGKVLRAIVEMRRPATMSFSEMMTELKCGQCGQYNDRFGNDVLF